MNDRVKEELLAEAAGRATSRHLAMRALKVRAAALPRIRWKGQNVITTEGLAQFYGTEPLNIQVNHSRNTERFELGIHYHKVTGRDLRDLRLTLSMEQISPMTRSLILWTERGATRHAKMIETDQAWDAFTALEDHYFKQFEVDPDQEPSTVEDREVLIVAAYRLSTQNKISMSKAHTIHNEAAGVDHYPKMTKGGVKQAVQASAPLIERTASEEHFAQIEARKKVLAGPTSQLALPLHEPPEDGG